MKREELDVAPTAFHRKRSSVKRAEVQATLFTMRAQPCESVHVTFGGLLAILNDVRTRMPGWFAFSGNVDAWWRTQNRISVVGDGDSLRIMGEVAEWNALAFARNVDGQLI